MDRGVCYLILNFFNINAFKLEGTTFETLPSLDPPTGITNVTTEQPAIRGIYNLNGQRVNELQKGINIVNGKKILNK